MIRTHLFHLPKINILCIKMGTDNPGGKEEWRRGGFGQRKKRGGGKAKKRRGIGTKSREIATIKGKKALKLDFSSFSSRFLGTLRGKIVESPSSGWQTSSFSLRSLHLQFISLPLRRMCHPHNIFPLLRRPKEPDSRI